MSKLISIGVILEFCVAVAIKCSPLLRNTNLEENYSVRMLVIWKKIQDMVLWGFTLLNTAQNEQKFYLKNKMDEFTQN